MKYFIFTKDQTVGEVSYSLRRAICKSEIAYVEEGLVPSQEEGAAPERLLEVYLKVNHDMQVPKKTTNKGVPQEFTYAEVVMSVQIKGDELIDSFFNFLNND